MTAALPHLTATGEQGRLRLPRSLTGHGIRQFGGFDLLLINIPSAVTPLAWRHSRRDNASPRRIGRRI